jgi:hypothetical protein
MAFTFVYLTLVGVPRPALVFHAGDCMLSLLFFAVPALPTALLMLVTTSLISSPACC